MKNRFPWAVGLLLLTIGGCGDRESPGTPAAAEAQPSTAPATTRAAMQDPAGEQKLYGTWVATDVDSKLGQVTIRLTFHKDGPVKLVAWSEVPLVGQVRDKSAPFEVHGNVISSDAIRGGTSVKYRFAGDELIIEYQDGKTVRFTRQ